VAGLDLDQLGDATADVPSCEVGRGDLAAGVDLADLVAATGLAESKGKARQFVADGAISINGTKVDGAREVHADDLLHDAVVLLRRGKRQWAVVRAAD